MQETNVSQMLVMERCQCRWKEKSHEEAKEEAKKQIIR
jgi:hypothetical protein